MANLGIKVETVLEKFFEVNEDTAIKGLYELRPVNEPNSEILCYVFNSNNATYHSSGNDCVIRDINQSNSGYIERLKAAYEKAAATGIKIFWFVLVFGDGISLKPDGYDWIASIELKVPLDKITASLSMRKYPVGKDKEGYFAPCIKRIEQDKYFNTTFISCKDDSGNFVDTFLKTYIEIYDNRGWKIGVENNMNELDITSMADKEVRNRIIFGAPGTGKSHKLEMESDLFKDTSATKTDDNELMKQEIYALGSDRSNSFAIGIKYFDKLKDKKIKDLQNEYNCNRHSSYAIYQAIRVYEKIGQLPDFGDEISDEKIKQELDEILKVKYMNQAGAAAIGFKYSDHLDGRTINELKEDFAFGEGGSLAHWLYYGVQAANYQFEKSEGKSIKKIERVTFHPNYSYSQFVGTYKPIKSKFNPEEITYEYVPGPFMRVYVNAKRNPEKKFLLLIEEINRANVAAVFGDVFQLLDRKNDGTSQYPISATEDQKNYLESCGIFEDEIAIPANMYIWATMNSADQGVLPMDAAFKRRWDFEYLGIDDNQAQISTYSIPFTRNGSKTINWNDFRVKLNEKLAVELKINEDKQLGPFFMNENSLKNAALNPDKFVRLFESKVLMYLYEDVVKMNPKKLFSNCGEDLRYSKICEQWELNGPAIFNIDCEVSTSEVASE